MVGGQKFGCSHPSPCRVLPPDFKQAKSECLSEWCPKAHTAAIRLVPFLHPSSNRGDIMISQLNRFKNLYSLPGYTALIWVAYSWARQADLTESSYPATNFRLRAPPPAWAGDGSCSISEPAGRCQQAARPALCWQSSVQVTASYGKLSHLFLSSHLSKNSCMTCLPVMWACPRPSVPPASIMLPGTFSETGHSQLSFFTHKDWTWRLKISAWLFKKLFRSREHNTFILILSNSEAENTFRLVFLLLFTKWVSIPSMGNRRTVSRGKESKPPAWANGR